MPEITFNGPAGKLEGSFYQQEDLNAPSVLILHPNPLHGGNMNSKVVFTLHKAFYEKGFNTMRFNFRGVGRSDGVREGNESEIGDAAAAMDWLQGQTPQASAYFVAGFSFGAWVAMQLIMRRPEIQDFVSVSPPANMHNFGFLSPCPIPGLIVQGTNDDIVPYLKVQELVDFLRGQKGSRVKFEIVEGADHFFVNHLEILKNKTMGYIQDKIAKETPALAC